MYPPGPQISNRSQALSDEDELNLCPAEKQWTSGRITVDSGAADSVWPEGLMPEIHISQPVRTGCSTSGRRRSTSRRRTG